MADIDSNRYIEENPVKESVSDLSDPSIVMPVGRLDADQYAAEDLDGVTESVFGSGNMNYLGLQSRQANDAIDMRGSFLLPDAQNTLSHPADVQARPDIAPGGGMQQLAGAPTDTDRDLYRSDESSGGQVQINDGQYAHSTVGSVAASALSSDSGAFSRFSSNLRSSNTGLNGENGGDGAPAESTSGQNGQNGQNGRDGQNGQDGNGGGDCQGHDGCGTTIINNDIHFGDIVVNIDNTLIDLGTSITNLTTTINNSATVLGDVINNLNQGLVVNIENVTNTVITITENLTNTVTTIITDITDITNILNNGGLGDVALRLDLGVLDTLKARLDATLDDSLHGSVNVEALTANLSTIVADLTNIQLPLVGDTGLKLDFDLVGGGAAPDGADIAVQGLNLGGLTLPGIQLDAIEDIVGDIDLNIQVPAALTSIPALVTGLEGTVASLAHLSVPSLSEVLDTAGAQHIDGALDAILGDFQLGDDFDVSVNDILQPVTGPLNGLAEQLAGLGGLDGLGDALAGLGGAAAALGEAVEYLTQFSGDNVPLAEALAPLSDFAAGAAGTIDTAVGGVLETLGCGGVGLEPVVAGAEQVLENLPAGGFEYLPIADVVENIASSVQGGDVDAVVQDILPAAGGAENALAPIAEAIGLDSDAGYGLGLGEEIIQTVQDIAQNFDLGGTEDMPQPLEDILPDLTGPIDSGIADVIQILDVTAPSQVTDTIAQAQTGLSNWTESTIGNGGGLFGDIIQSATYSLDVLPEPVGTVAEGIGALNVDPPHVIAKTLGGLFGH